MDLNAGNVSNSSLRSTGCGISFVIVGFDLLHTGNGTLSAMPSTPRFICRGV